MSNNTTDDTLLLQETGCGDRESLDELYRRYSRVLFATAFRVLNNPSDAEDVLQEVFVQIWEKAARYDPRRGKPLTWALTLTRNRAIDRLRRVQRRNRLHDDVQREVAVFEKPAGVESSHAAAQRDIQSVVRSAVMQLSPEQRRAIELAFFSGLTQTEVAERLDQPLGTIKARIRRGMLRLRQIVEPKL